MSGYGDVSLDADRKTENPFGQHDAPLAWTSGRVSDVQLHSETRLDMAIGDYCRRMEFIDERSTHRGASDDEILLLTTKASMYLALACADFERQANNDREAVAFARRRVRERTDYLFRRSFFMNARSWPKNIPGDHEMIEFIYKNVPASQGVGRALDRYFLSTTLSVAVRERKEMLREMLGRELASRQGPRILDIGCGSCREVMELAPEITASRAVFTCVDIDQDALSYAEARLRVAGVSDQQVSFRKYNVLRMVNPERNRKEFGAHDIIYSVGLFDYLDDDPLVRLFASLLALVKKGGSLIVSLKDCRAYRTFDTSWLLNWDAFYKRREEDMWALFAAAGIDRPRIEARREATGVIVFFTIRNE